MLAGLSRHMPLLDRVARVREPTRALAQTPAAAPTGISRPQPTRSVLPTQGPTPEPTRAPAPDRNARYLALERRLIDTLPSSTGRDLAAWMEDIRSSGITNRNDLIDWLRHQGLSYADASWIERIFHNGGKPVYLGQDAKALPMRKPAAKQQAQALLALMQARGVVGEVRHEIVAEHYAALLDDKGWGSRPWQSVGEHFNPLTGGRRFRNFWDDYGRCHRLRVYDIPPPIVPFYADEETRTPAGRVAPQPEQQRVAA